MRAKIDRELCAARRLVPVLHTFYHSTYFQSSRLKDVYGSLVIRAGNSLIWFPSESLIFVQKWANERFAQKNEGFTHSLIFSEQNERFPLIAHFLWAIRSRLLICLERSERIAHSHSFDLSEMRKCANVRWGNSQPCLLSVLLIRIRLMFLFVLIN